MNKKIFFFCIAVFNYIMIMFNNLDNVNVIITSSVMMISFYMIFQSSLPPMTNILSYWMASEKDKVKAVREHDASLGAAE